MNKNPTRPKKMDKIISSIVNPKKKKVPQYKKAEKEVLRSVFGE